jgi:hypothetical protein
MNRIFMPGLGSNIAQSAKSPQTPLPGPFSALLLKEEADEYPTVARLNPRWRVIVCKNATQWIIQGRISAREWRAVWFCHTRDGLLRGARERVAGPIGDNALVVLLRFMTSSCARRANRRLDRVIKRLIKTRGDDCGICRREFANNDLTFYGIAFGAIAVTGTCCRARLNPEITVGVYLARTGARNV